MSILPRRTDKSYTPREPYVYRYEVTESTVDSVAVGSHLIDKRRQLWHTWEFIDFDSGVITSITGRRVGDRLCPTCYRTHRKATLFGHPGMHKDAPKHDLAQGSEVSP